MDAKVASLFFFFFPPLLHSKNFSEKQDISFKLILNAINQTVCLYRTFKEVWAFTISAAGQLYTLKLNIWDK